MDRERTPADRGTLAGLMRAAFGAQRHLSAVTRLRGASKKGVYRAAFDDESTAIIYIWDAREDYWPAAEAAEAAEAADPGGSHADPFSHASGLDLFQAAQARLDGLGIRTPRLYLADPSRQHYPADVAVLEDASGATLEALLEDDPRRARPVLERLDHALQVMHAHKAPGFGKVLHLSNGGTSRGSSCEHLVLERALRDLAEASARDSRIMKASPRLEAALRCHAAIVRPRSDYSLIHGELGPDHVLVDRKGHPVFIDIEGLMYFDAEWEHVFLRLRFGQHYRFLRGRELDQDRLKLYRLALHLSLVAGPLRLLDGDYPERAPMMRIAEYNTLQALSLQLGT